MSDFSEAERQAVYRAIFERRDVRNYRPDPLPSAVLRRILEAAHHAPSVGFMQPWSFVLLRDRGLRERIHAHFAEVNTRAAEVFHDDRRRAYQALKLQGILDAPLNLLVTCDREREGPHVLGRFTMPETDLYSTCLAVENLWLAARAEGVGVGWMSIMEPGAVAALLGLPTSVVPVAYLTLGYPVEHAAQPLLSQVGWQQRRPLDELVFEDGWGRRADWEQTGSDLSADSNTQERGDGVNAVEDGPLAPAPPPPAAALARNLALTKPAGSLGRVEALTLKLAGLQGTAYPSAVHAHLTLFASDHGVTVERVSPYRPDTTLKLVYGFLAEAGVINALARQQRVPVHVVDVGVDHDFGDARGLTRRKVRRGTRNLAREPAMTDAECSVARKVGSEVVAALPALEVLMVGEVGIGNTTSAAALTSALLGLPVEATVGRGTGVDDAGLARKREVVTRALALHAAEPRTPEDLLARLGGYEIAALAGAIEAAARRGALVLLDGMTTTVAALVAVRREPAVASYLVAAHESPEPAHARLLEALDLTPLLSMQMRLGEGSGALLALGPLRAGCAVMREVRTYAEANIARPEYSDRDHA
ncbi:MAG: nicotinate-nucleotide--dimethylbenzimidazole phosphoribosyltransferase [Polyangiales bacterium]